MIKAKKLLIFTLLFFSLVTVCLCIGFSMVLPAYIEKKLMPDLVHQAGIEGFGWNVRKIGLSGSDFGAIRIGDQTENPISISSIQINYSLSGLLRRHLKSIHICGLSIPFELKEGKFVLPGLDMNTVLSNRNGHSEKKGGTLQSLPVSFERIVLQQAVITAKVNHHILRLPLDLTIQSAKEKSDPFEFEINFYPFEIPIHVRAEIEPATGGLKIFCNAQKLKLENFLSYLTQDKDVHLKGIMDLTVYAEGNIDPFEISAVNILMGSNEFSFFSENFRLGKSNEKNEAFTVRVESEELSEWNISVSGLKMKSPALLEIPEFNAELSIGTDTLDCNFKMDTVFEGFNHQKLEITPPFYRRWNGSAKVFDKTAWIVDMNIMPPEELLDKQSSGWYRIKSHDADIGFFVPRIHVSGEGDLQNGYAKGRLEMSGGYLDTHAASLELPNTILNVETAPIEKTNETVQLLNFDVRFMNTFLRIASADSKFHDIFIKGSTVLTDPEFEILGKVQISGGDLTDTMYDVSAKGIRFELPWVWPPGHKTDTGFFEIEALGYKDENIGKIRATLRQEGHGGEINGKFDSWLYRGLSLNFEGYMGKTEKGLETRINFEIPKYKTPDRLNLADFFPGADGVFIDGQIGLTGYIHQLGQKMASSVHIDAHRFHISMEEPEVAVNNVRMDLKLADLFEMRSLPHQHIQFDSASIGNIRLNDGSIYFQIQSADRFFIEKTSFKWAGGNVDTNAVSLSFPIDNFGLTFYCDRLKLAQVLEQLGGIRGEGEGAVNGRIPVRYEDGKIIFDDGFLYSTPGDGGIIRLTGTDILMSGIPKGTPQFTQVDLAREALKHYQYDWAKLEMNTHRENLFMQLKMDGKPVEILPFEYRQDFGGFIRVDADSPGSRFQGIRLDVNFNLPLDQILKYGKGFQDILRMGN